MIIRFELTMPNVGSWNGADTGNRPNYFIFKNLSKKQAESLNDKSFYYNFGDGWGANVECKKSRRTKTNGFRGYDWMVKEILEYGEILELSKRREMRNSGTY